MFTGLLLVATMKWWVGLIIAILSLIVGAVVGFIIARVVFKKYLEKNPPVNEKMIRVMFQQMGRTPSEKQVKQVIAQMNMHKNN